MSDTTKEETKEEQILSCRLTRQLINEACNIKEYSNKNKYPYIRYLPFTTPSQDFIATDLKVFENKKQALVLNKGKTLEVFRKEHSFLFDEILCKIQDPNYCKVREEIICKVQCYWIEYQGSDIKNGVIFMLHGGGFVVGTAKQTFGESELISKVTGCVCIGINYSLAPEKPLPYAVLEVVEIYKYCLNTLKIPSNRIAFNGDSAGGGLALLSVQRILNTEKDIDVPSCVWVNSPFTNLAADFPSIKRNEQYDSVLNVKYHLDLYPGWAIGNYAAEFDDDKWKTVNSNNLKDPKYCAAEGVWKGFCPIYFMVGATEMILDDTLISAKRAYENGVEVKVDIEPFMYHAWTFIPTIAEARIAIIRGSEWIMQHFK